MVDSSGRWWEWSTERQMHCPAGHHLPFKQRINETGFIRCSRVDPGYRNDGRAQATQFSARERRGMGLEQECGRWLFVYAIRGDGVVVAEVSLDEMDEMRDLATPAAMLNYLQIFPTRKAG